MSSRSSPDRAPLPPPAALAIHLDLVGGIAGDMFVAALGDALPALRDRVLSELSAMHPEGAGLPGFHDAASGGLRACRFGLARAPADVQPPRATHAHAGAQEAARRGHRHAPGAGDGAGARVHAHAGTAYAVLRRRLDDAPLPASTRAHALALLALLAGAEARVHGIAVDDVHFHELADWDSLLDLVAAGCIAAALDGAQWTASAPPLGGGTVRTEHGLLPVPAPAAAELLTGFPWHDDGIGGERVTPTGAAILRHLVPAAACAGHRAGGRLAAVGCGAGTRELPGTPNVVRALVFERTTAGATDAVAIVEFDVDDMSGEEIAVAGERLRAEHGVIDVTIGNRVGKKGRPVADFRLLAAPAAAEEVVRACFLETSTLGLRVRDERRRLVARAEVATAVDGSALRVKVAERPDGRRTAKTAHDDVAAAPGLATRRRVRAAGESRALGGDDE
jgi:pyridinium-3,5-bisthiocarboxylic acid mononucleotide nickel chelatase